MRLLAQGTGSAPRVVACETWAWASVLGNLDSSFAEGSPSSTASAVVLDISWSEEGMAFVPETSSASGPAGIAAKPGQALAQSDVVEVAVELAELSSF